MKPFTNSSTVKWVFFIVTVLFFSCKKDDKVPLKQANTDSSEVVLKWIDMKTRIMLQGDPSQRPGFDRTLTVRFYAYLGITLCEAVVLGMIWIKQSNI